MMKKLLLILLCLPMIGFGQCTVSISATDISCYGMCNGTATAIPSGGTGPYTYLWDDALAQTTQAATGLCPGTYTVTVEDANACITTNSVTITEPDQIILNLTITDASCFGMCDGTATVIVDGGTPPYTYQWNNGTTPTLSGCAGTYTVTVVDANGCTTTNSFTINEPTMLSATLTATDETAALNDGTATATVLGGTLGYTYLWDDASIQITQIATGLAAGNYTVTIVDANGCAISEVTTVNAYTPTSVINVKSTTKTLINITDMLGQKATYRNQTPLFYIYDDGTVEKRIIIE